MQDRRQVRRARREGVEAMMADPPAYAAEGLHTLPQLQVRCKLAVTSCWQFGICCFVCCLLRSSAI